MSVQLRSIICQDGCCSWTSIDSQLTYVAIALNFDLTIYNYSLPMHVAVTNSPGWSTVSQALTAPAKWGQSSEVGHDQVTFVTINIMQITVIYIVCNWLNNTFEPLLAYTVYAMHCNNINTHKHIKWSHALVDTEVHCHSQCKRIIIDALQCVTNTVTPCDSWHHSVGC